MTAQKVKVKYVGEQAEVSHPIFSEVMVKRGVVLEVPADLRLTAHWVDANAPAPTELLPKPATDEAKPAPAPKEK